MVARSGDYSACSDSVFSSQPDCGFFYISYSWRSTILVYISLSLSI